MISLETGAALVDQHRLLKHPLYRSWIRLSDGEVAQRMQADVQVAIADERRGGADELKLPAD